MPRTMRLAPAITAIVGSAVITTAGIPARSIAVVSVATQRVPVPQVPVRMTACTAESRSRCAISAPNAAAATTGVELPVVV
jgi:hypothetical protein